MGSDRVFSLLQSDANAPVVKQGCSARPSGPATWNRRHCADFVRTASLLRADIIFGRDTQETRIHGDQSAIIGASADHLLGSTEQPPMQRDCGLTKSSV